MKMTSLIQICIGDQIVRRKAPDFALFEARGRDVKRVPIGRSEALVEGPQLVFWQLLFYFVIPLAAAVEIDIKSAIGSLIRRGVFGFLKGADVTVGRTGMVLDDRQSSAVAGDCLFEPPQFLQG